MIYTRIRFFQWLWRFQLEFASVRFHGKSPTAPFVFSFCSPPCTAQKPPRSYWRKPRRPKSWDQLCDKQQNGYFKLSWKFGAASCPIPSWFCEIKSSQITSQGRELHIHLICCGMAFRRPPCFYDSWWLSFSGTELPTRWMSFKDASPLVVTSSFHRGNDKPLVVVGLWFFRDAARHVFRNLPRMWDEFRVPGPGNTLRLVSWPDPQSKESSFPLKAVRNS